jgi:hypothetical protein
MMLGGIELAASSYIGEIGENVIDGLVSEFGLAKPVWNA